jgi:hypothetical protein
MYAQSATWSVVEMSYRDRRGVEPCGERQETVSCGPPSRKNKELTYGANELAFRLMV